MPSQRERSEATRARILDAAVRVLVERGYAAASTPRIVEEAGLSRGAMLHHFPNKAELMKSVLRHVLEVRERAFHEALDQAHDADPVSAVLDAFWGAVGAEEAFVPWLELTVAARTEPGLQDVLGTAALDLEQVIRSNFERLLEVDDAFGFADLLPTLGISLLQGLAMRSIVHPEPERSDRVLGLVKLIAQQFLRASRGRG